MLKFFRSSANQRLVGRLLKESFRKHAVAYGIAIAAMLVVAAMTAASAWIMRDVTNEFVGPKDIQTIYLIAGAVATIFIFKGVATYVQSLFLSRAGNTIIAERQRKIYDRMLDHGIEFYHSYSSADLIMRLTQSAQAARSVVDTLVTSFVRDLFSLIGLVMVMVVQQPVLSLVAFIFGPAAIFAVNRLLKRTKRIMEKEFLSIAKIMQVMQETVFGVRIVKSFNLESTMRKQMYKAVADVAEAREQHRGAGSDHQPDHGDAGRAGDRRGHPDQRLSGRAGGAYAGRDHGLHHRASARLRAGQAAGAHPGLARNRHGRRAHDVRDRRPAAEAGGGARRQAAVGRARRNPVRRREVLLSRRRAGAERPQPRLSGGPR